MADPEVLNEALIECLPLAWNIRVQERITAAYGSEVTNEVKGLYEYTVRRPVDWTQETHDQATARVATEIGDAYPFLTAKAIEKLAKCSWYVWLF